MTLSFEQQTIFVRAWYLFIYWHICISWVPYKKWRHRLTLQPKHVSHLSQSDIYDIVKLTEAVGRHHFVKVNCLRRCMVQKSLLNKMQVSTQLVIGVKKVNGFFSAHCWLTYNEQLINDSLEVISEYSVLQKTSSDMTGADVLQGML